MTQIAGLLESGKNGQNFITELYLGEFQRKLTR